MASALAARPSQRARISGARTGDAVLFLFWTAQGTLSTIRAVKLGLDRDFQGAIHVATVAVILFISAALFVLRGPAKGRAGGLLPKLIAFIGTWSIIALAALPMTWRPEWLLTGSTIGLVGAYAWVIWSLLTLRRNLSIFPEARRLVRHGPYALVRHPLYSAHIVCYVLIALPRLSVWALLIAALGIAGELLRARFEERLLASAFDDYAAYAATTPRFVPRFKRWHTFADPPGVPSLATNEIG